MMRIQEIYTYLDGFAPFETQAAWDNSGLLIGSGDTAVERVLIALDVTLQTAQYAAENSCGLIVSHHPVIFRAVKSIPRSSVVHTLIRNGIAVISAHTNLDKAPGGVNDTLCERIGMEYEKAGESAGDGFLNIGTLKNAFDAKGFAVYLSKRLDASVRYIDGGETLERIAVCAGAGGEFAAQAKALGCSALVTGDADHHDFLDAAALGVSLFAAGHYATEVPVTDVLYRKLSNAFPDTEFLVCPKNDPIVTVN